MVRPYKMLGQKRKKRKAEKYEKVVEEPEPETVAEEVEEEEEEEEDGGNGAESSEMKSTEEKEMKSVEEVGTELPSFPIVEQGQKSVNRPGVIFILEKASLEIAKVGKSMQLLNSDKHSNFLRRHGKNPAEYRPDIAHQALLMILDSPLNKAGHLKAVYVHTEKGVLIEIKPHVRIPRTFDRFAGVMLQLLQKFSITAVGKREKLLSTIKKPVTQYLPADSLKIGFSFSSQKLVNIQNYVRSTSNDKTLVFVVGAMAHGKVEVDYVDDFISISGYQLSAATCIAKIHIAVEQKWGIL